MAFRGGPVAVGEPYALTTGPLVLDATFLDSKFPMKFEDETFTIF